MYSPAVHIAKSICIESKKKNMTRSEMEAPSGRHSACIVSKVCTSRPNVADFNVILGHIMDIVSINVCKKRRKVQVHKSLVIIT